MDAAAAAQRSDPAGDIQHAGIDQPGTDTAADAKRQAKFAGGGHRGIEAARGRVGTAPADGGPPEQQAPHGGSDGQGGQGGQRVNVAGSFMGAPDMSAPISNAGNSLMPIDFHELSRRDPALTAAHASAGSVIFDNLINGDNAQFLERLPWAAVQGTGVAFDQFLGAVPQSLSDVAGKAAKGDAVAKGVGEALPLVGPVIQQSEAAAQLRAMTQKGWFGDERARQYLQAHKDDNPLFAAMAKADDELWNSTAISDHMENWTQQAAAGGLQMAGGFGPWWLAQMSTTMPHDVTQVPAWLAQHNEPRHLAEDVQQIAQHPGSAITLDMGLRLGLHALGTVVTVGELTKKGRMIMGPARGVAKFLPGLNAFARDAETSVRGVRALDPSAKITPDHWAAKGDPTAMAARLTQIHPVDSTAMLQEARARAAVGTQGVDQKVIRSAKRSLAAVGVKNMDQLLQKGAAMDFSPKQSQYIAKHIAEWSKVFGSAFDFRRMSAADREFPDPHIHLEQMPPEMHDPFRQLIHTHMQSLMGQVFSGPHGDSENIMGGLTETLMGHSEANRIAVDDFQVALHKARAAAENAGVDVGPAVIRRAMESHAAYDALEHPAQRAIVDVLRGLDATWAEKAREVDILHGRRAGYLARVPKGVVDEEGRTVQTSGRSGSGAHNYVKHRTEVVTADPETGGLALTQQHASIDALNKSQSERAGAMADALLTHPSQGTPAELKRLLTSKYAQAREDLSKLAKTDLAAAQAAAKKIAGEEYQQYEMDPYKIFARTFGSRLQDLKIAQAMHVLSQHGALVGGSTLEDGTQVGGRLARLAYKKTENLDTELRGIGQHFRPIDHPMFDGWVAHNDFADRLEKMLRRAPAQNKAMQSWTNASALFSKGVVSLLPMVHMNNIFRRFVPFMMTNPMDLAHHVMGTKFASAADKELANRQMMLEAGNYGVVLWNKSRRTINSINEGIGKALNDDSVIGTTEHDASGLTDEQKASGPHVFDPLVKVGQPFSNWAKNAYHWEQDMLWQHTVQRFAVAAWAVESEKAMKAGLSEVDAKIVAAKRANAWAGHIASWDKNPGTFRALSRAFLAPTWQKSFIDIFAGQYNKEALGNYPALQKYLMKQEMRTTMAFMTANHAMGNALNMITSGHPQTAMFGLPGNRPGNENKVEMNNFIPDDAKTGARSTWNNYLGSSQLQDWEKVFGPSWLGGDGSKVDQPGVPGPLQPIAQRAPAAGAELAAKANPFLSAIAAAWNLDLYQTATSGVPREIDRHAGPLNPHALLQTMADATPFGQNLSIWQRQAQYQLQQDPWAKTPLGKEWGPLSGITVPHNIQTQMGSPTHVTQALAALFLGARVPWYQIPRSPQAFGQEITDQHRNKNEQAVGDLRNQQQAADAAFTSGNLEPQKWLQDYHTRLDGERQLLNELYSGSPHYTGGTMGDYFKYEDLYRQATNAQGDLDFDKLHTLQTQYLGTLDPTRENALKDYVAQRNQTSKVAGVYHTVVSHYQHQQDVAAGQVGASSQEMNRQYSEYAKVQGSAEQKAYLADHPQFQQWKALLGDWETGSWTGLMYGLFHNHSRVVNWMQKNGYTQAQVEQRAEQVSEQEQQQNPQSAAAVGG